MTHAFRIECVDHTSEPIARLIHLVQMSAYAQEAKLLGVVDFPPLSATVRDIRTCAEEFIVAYADNQIVGAVSVAPEPEFMGTNITALVVDPLFQRRGIARRLVAEVLHRYGAGTVTVQTGAENQPALGLYVQSGFVEIRRWHIAQHALDLVKLCRLPMPTTPSPRTNVKIRDATIGDLPVVLHLLRECVGGMRDGGIDQWDDVYPDHPTIERDVAEAAAFVATVDDVVVGFAVLNEHQEPEYGDVPWLFGGRPAVIHRLMVAPSAEGQGVARALMAHLETQARSRAFDGIRLDAFAQNARAMRFYERSNYRHAGQVRFRKGDCHCFEKQLRSGG